MRTREPCFLNVSRMHLLHQLQNLGIDDESYLRSGEHCPYNFDVCGFYEHLRAVSCKGLMPLWGMSLGH